MCSSDTAKAQALWGQYDRVFTKEKLDSLPTMPPSPFSDTLENDFTVPGIRKQLEAIRPDKACGPDLSPARVLGDAASELALALTSLFQQSCDTGVLPSACKEADVSATFKKGQRSDPAKHRPVSLTSLASKVMEHVVCRHMSQQLTENSIISPHQHGFLRLLSCETQLVTVIHNGPRH